MMTMTITTMPNPIASGQVALGGFQRDGSGHGAGEAVDIASDDDHRAHFGGGAAEAGKQCRHQREAAVPDKGSRSAPSGPTFIAASSS